MSTFCVANTAIGCGNGLCDSTGSFCTCDPGYTYDFTVGLYRNCYLPITGLNAGYLVVGISCCLVALWSLYELTVKRNSRSMARHIQMLVLVGQTLGGFEMLAHYLEQLSGYFTTILMILVMTFGLSVPMVLILLSFILPVFKFAPKTKLVPLKRSFNYFAVGVVLLPGTIMLASVISLGGAAPTAGAQHTYTVLMETGYFVYSLMALYLFPVVYVTANVIIQALDRSIRTSKVFGRKKNTSQHGEMVKLMYSSQLMKHEGLSYEEMGKEIAEKAALVNARLGITGVLAVNIDDGQAIQILEGKPDQVTALYDKIALDPRHRITNCVKNIPITQRFYNHWGMVYSDASCYQALSEILPDINAAAPGKGGDQTAAVSERFDQAKLEIAAKKMKALRVQMLAGSTDQVEKMAEFRRRAMHARSQLLFLFGSMLLIGLVMFAFVLFATPSFNVAHRAAGYFLLKMILPIFGVCALVYTTVGGANAGIMSSNAMSSKVVGSKLSREGSKVNLSVVPPSPTSSKASMPAAMRESFELVSRESGEQDMV